jgi:hypothetical protein
MWAAYAGFVLLSINPFGGLLFSIPYAQNVLHVSPWLAALAGWPLAYVQVALVDLFWDALSRLAWFERAVHKRRTPRLDRAASSKHMFWFILAFGAFCGPWLVMAVMRYANVPQRRIALPMALCLGWNAAAIALVAVHAPRLLAR